MDESGSESQAKKNSAPPGDKADSNESTNDSLLGLLLENRYEILDRVGAGATAIAYRARDVLLDRIVAIKIIHAHLLLKDDAIERFKNEVQTSSQFSHPNIAQVYSGGVASDGRLYMVLDYLEGRSLSELLQAEHKLSLKEFCEIFQQAISALNYAHEQGVLHRDIKPDNIMVARENGGTKIMLVDFGLAKLIENSSEQNSTKTGMLLGSAAYMSPEQCKGSRDLDVRSDIYALGCVMLEALTGEILFQGATPVEVMYKHLSELPEQRKLLALLPAPISAMIEKCLKIDRSLRYQSVAELAAEFRKITEVQDTIQRKWTRTLEASPGNKFGWRSKFLAGLGLLAIVLATIWLVHDLLKKEKMEKLNSVQRDSKKTLTPIDQIHHIPSQVSGVQKLLREYKYDDPKKTNETAILILKRWEKEHGNSAGEERYEIYAQEAGNYARLQDVPNAMHYWKLIRQKNTMPANTWAVASAICQMFRMEGMPEKGIAIVQETCKAYPDSVNNAITAPSIGAMGSCYFDLGNYKEALRCYQRCDELLSFDGNEKKPALDNPLRVELIKILCLMGRKSETPTIIQKCIEASRSYMSFDHKALAEGYGQFGIMFRSIDEFDEARTYLEKAVVEYSKLALTADQIRCELLLVSCYESLNQYGKAFQVLQTIKSQQSSWADKLTTISRMGTLAYRMGDAASKAKQLEQATSSCRTAWAQLNNVSCSSAALQIGVCITQCVQLLVADKKYDQSQRLIDEWITRLNADHQPSLPGGFLYRSKYIMLMAEHKYDEAQIASDKELSIFLSPEVLHCAQEIGQDMNSIQAGTYEMRSQLFDRKLKPELAVEAMEHSFKLTEKDQSRLGNYVQLLVEIGHRYELLGKPEKAEAYYSRVEPSWRIINHVCTENRIWQLSTVAKFESSRANYTVANRLYRECISNLTISPHKNVVQLSSILCNAAETLASDGRFAEAEADIVEAEKIAKTIPSPNPQSEILRVQIETSKRILKTLEAKKAR